MADGTPTAGWTLPQGPTPGGDMPFANTMPGGRNMPYGSLGAQLLDAFMISRTLPGAPGGGYENHRYDWARGLLAPGGGFPLPGGSGGGVGGGPGGGGGVPGGGGGAPGGGQGGGGGILNPPPGWHPSTGIVGNNMPGGTQSGTQVPIGFGQPTPQAVSASNPFGVDANTLSGAGYQHLLAGYNRLLAQPGANPDQLAVIRSGLLQHANPSTPLGHGGANVGYTQQANGDYSGSANSGGVMYGTGTPQNMRPDGTFQTSNGQAPGLSPDGMPAFRVGPNTWQYARRPTDTNARWGP